MSETERSERIGAHEKKDMSKEKGPPWKLKEKGEVKKEKREKQKIILNIKIQKVYINLLIIFWISNIYKEILLLHHLI